MDYIWIDDKTPILNQVKDKFKNAIVIPNPFIQMPSGWTNNKRIINFIDAYPTNEEIIEFGEPVMWSQLVKNTGLEDSESLALAMKTYITALNKDYARNDLMERFELGLTEDLYLPNEDKISHFLIPTILEVFRVKKSKSMHISDPLFDITSEFSIEEATIQEIYESTPTEIIITDEFNDTAFMSVYDSFITLMLTNDQNLYEVIISGGWEVVACDKNTKINWYLKG